MALNRALAVFIKVTTEIAARLAPGSQWLAGRPGRLRWRRPFSGGREGRFLCNDGLRSGGRCRGRRSTAGHVRDRRDCLDSRAADGLGRLCRPLLAICLHGLALVEQARLVDLFVDQPTRALLLHLAKIQAGAPCLPEYLVSRFGLPLGRQRRMLVSQSLARGIPGAIDIRVDQPFLCVVASQGLLVLVLVGHLSVKTAAMPARQLLEGRRIVDGRIRGAGLVRVADGPRVPCLDFASRQLPGLAGLARPAPARARGLPFAPGAPGRGRPGLPIRRLGRQLLAELALALRRHQVIEILEARLIDLTRLRLSGTGLGLAALRHGCRILRWGACLFGHGLDLDLRRRRLGHGLLWRRLDRGRRLARRRGLLRRGLLRRCRLVGRGLLRLRHRLRRGLIGRLRAPTLMRRCEIRLRLLHRFIRRFGDHDRPGAGRSRRLAARCNLLRRLDALVHAMLGGLRPDEAADEPGRRAGRFLDRRALRHDVARIGLAREQMQRAKRGDQFLEHQRVDRVEGERGGTGGRQGRCHRHEQRHGGASRGHGRE